MLPTERMAKHIWSEIDGALCSGTARDMEGKQNRIVKLDNSHIMSGKKVDADSISVVRVIPEIFLVLCSLFMREPVKSDSALALAAAENYDPAFIVCHGAISFPKASREAAFGRLKFPVGCFTNSGSPKYFIEQIRRHVRMPLTLS